MTSFLPLELNDIGFMPRKKKGILCAWNVPAMFITSGKLFLRKKIVTLAVWPVNI